MPADPLRPSCPAGHSSESEDYCSVCGAAMESGTPQSAPQSSDPSEVACPSCQAANPPTALFCEACGYDYTTGAMPRAVLPEPAVGPQSQPTPPRRPVPQPSAQWVLELWIDPAWYALQQSPDPMPSPGLPQVLVLRQRSLLVGRPSRSRGIAPEIDCEPDSGVSRQHARLSTDGSRWFVEDLDSANGTYIAPAAAPLPTEPIPAERRRELEGDDRIYLGAWTRLVLRRATAEEESETEPDEAGDASTPASISGLSKPR